MKPRLMESPKGKMASSMETTVQSTKTWTRSINLTPHARSLTLRRCGLVLDGVLGRHRNLDDDSCRHKGQAAGHSENSEEHGAVSNALGTIAEHARCSCSRVDSRRDGNRIWD
jgi:hypothetical protein